MIDAVNEFLFGPDLLIAPAPHPEDVDSYQVRFPPVTWYDYWTGAKIEHGSQSKPVTIHPTLDVTPVYVREGSILPIQPLVQSTTETPQGPLTLRVYPGHDCKGSLYLDDGISYAYTHGDFLRVNFECEVTEHAVRIHIGSRQGSHSAWWKDLSLEIYGTNALPQRVEVNGKSGTLFRTSFDASRHCFDIVVPDAGGAQDITIESGDHGSSADAKAARAGVAVEQPTETKPEQ